MSDFPVIPVSRTIELSPAGKLDDLYLNALWQQLCDRFLAGGRADTKPECRTNGHQGEE